MAPYLIPYFFFCGQSKGTFPLNTLSFPSTWLSLSLSSLFSFFFFFPPTRCLYPCSFSCHRHLYSRTRQLPWKPNCQLPRRQSFRQGRHRVKATSDSKGFASRHRFSHFLALFNLISQRFRCHSNQDSLIFKTMPFSPNKSLLLGTGLLFLSCLPWPFLVNWI